MEVFEDCPNCGKSYDDIDFDFQACSKCGWDAADNKFRPNIIRLPSEKDYLNGDADIKTGDFV